MNKDDKHNGVALIVIDIQMGLFERANPIYEADQFLKNVNTLIQDARQGGVPVIFIQHANENTLVRGSHEWQLHPEIQPLEGEIIIHKLEGDAFIDTELKDELEKRDVNCLVVTGLLTQQCVKETSLGALKRGYRVYLVSDGHSNFSKDAERLIKKWNQTISKKGAELVETKAVDFRRVGSGGE